MIKRISKNNQSVVIIILVFIVLVTTACTDKLNTNNKGMDAETNEYQVNTNDHSTDIVNDPTEAKEKSESIDPNYSSVNYTRVIIMKKLDLIAIGNFNKGLASAQNSDGLYGFVDYKGNWIIQPMYNSASDFSNGLALVKNTNNSLYINPAGNIILDSDNFDGYGFQRNFDSDGTTVISGTIEKDGVRTHYSSVVDMKANYIKVK